MKQSRRKPESPSYSNALDTSEKSGTFRLALALPELVRTLRGMKVSFKLAWYDLWIGAFWDQKKRTLYVCPLPMCLIVIETQQRSTLPQAKPTIEPIRGGHGVRGCPNPRPHSHAMDLARRLNEDRALEKTREHAERKAIREILQKAGRQ